MISLDEARALIVSRIHALPPERVALAEARGRMLRESVAAPEDMPAFDRSAFDGYALRAADLPGRLRVVAEIAAGAVPTQKIQAGEGVRIFTGAQLPGGADTVAMQEHCTRNGDWVEVAATEAGHGVRVRGEDARAGDVLLPRGQRLGPLEVSLLAQLGHTQPLVAPRLRVLHVVTGSELVAPESAPGPGQIRDSNSALIGALAAEAGCELLAQCRAGDDLESLLTAAGRIEGWEMLLISGGASVGDYDFGRAALEEMGFSVHFRALNLRPGKPLIFATRGRQFAFVLPGNPLSHFVCWQVTVRAAIDVALQGESAWELVEMRLGGDQPLAGHARETWWPARLEIRSGSAVAVPLRWQSSGDLTRLAGADGLIRVPTGKQGLEVGSLVHVLRV
jgi:molybdopterin molybdotransferase